MLLRLPDRFSLRPDVKPNVRLAISSKDKLGCSGMKEIELVNSLSLNEAFPIVFETESSESDSVQMRLEVFKKKAT